MVNESILKAGTVAVIQGGRSEEREISLRTGEAFARGLKARGYRVCTVDAADRLVEKLSETNPVAAVIALHGRWGEDGCVQGLLECLGIPYTGSGVMGSAVAMNKVVAKRLFGDAGLPTPEFIDIPAGSGKSNKQPSIEPPVVVKPAREGSSVGISIVHAKSDLDEAVEAAASLGGPVLIERYVEGREMSVAVLEGEALGTIEIVPARPFYDYEAKYGPDSGTKYLFPAPIPREIEEHLRALAVRAVEILNCGGVCRADFMLDGDNMPWLIEINTLPGMTEASLVPKIASGAGISFEELCERLLLGARLKA